MNEKGVSVSGNVPEDSVFFCIIRYLAKSLMQPGTTMWNHAFV